MTRQLLTGAILIDFSCDWVNNFNGVYTNRMDTVAEIDKSFICFKL